VLEFRRGSLPLGHLTPPGGCPRSKVSVKLGPAQPDAVGLLIESPSAARMPTPIQWSRSCGRVDWKLRMNLCVNAGHSAV